MSRQVIRVHYCIEDLFLIPENIDLNNKNQVKDWGVKWNTLYIYFVDGSEIQINSKGWVNDFDYKRPNDDYEPEPAEDFGYVDNDDEGFNPVDVYQPATEVAEVAKVVEPEPEPYEEPEVVKIIKVDGKKYLLARKSGNVYDFDAYVKTGDKTVVGKWNEEKQQIEFNNDFKEKEQTKLNRQKIVDIAKEYSVNHGRWEYVDILTDIKNLCNEYNVKMDKDIVFKCLECFSTDCYEQDDGTILFMEETIYYYDEKTCEWTEKNVDDDEVEIDELEKKYDEAIKNIKLPTAEEIKMSKPALDAAQLEKLFGN
jgi:hypothetical protein